MSNPREVRVGEITYRKDGEDWRILFAPEVEPLAELSAYSYLDALLAMQDERDEARAMVFDLFNQACRDGEWYDHMAISSYEDAQAALIEWGVIRPDQCKGR
jgi:hypothetical protein